MGGGGSMQSMQTVLKNNRNLLSGRKKRSYFKRELTYAQIRKSYKESTKPISDNSNQVDYKKIRQVILQERRKNLNIQIVLFLVISVLVSLAMYSTLFQTNTVKTGSTHFKIAPSMVTSDGFENFIVQGQQSLIKQEYFLAIGNFQRALQLRPNQRKAEFGLAKAYSKSCKYRQQFCQEASILILEMELKYPNQVGFTKLKERYLGNY